MSKQSEWNIDISKWSLEISGGSEIYVTHNGKFVVRFKYFHPTANARHFAKALEKLFTPEEYFAALDSGLAPLEIMQQRGYVSLNQLRAQRARIPQKEGK